MSRLIDADVLLEKQYCIDDSATLSTRDVVNVEDVGDAPTVQAVPIEVLDKIRAEIKQLPYQRIFGKVGNYSLLDVVIEIIDKYKAESEDEE